MDQRRGKKGRKPVIVQPWYLTDTLYVQVERQNFRSEVREVNQRVIFW